MIKTTIMLYILVAALFVAVALMVRYLTLWKKARTANANILIRFAERRAESRKWVAAEVRLPECVNEAESGCLLSEPCLTMDKDGIFRVLYLCKAFWTGNSYYFSWKAGSSDRSECVYAEITHWMPIPEMEKGGEK